MASKYCPECGHEVSDTAKFCTNCGCALKTEESVQPEPVKESEKVKDSKPKKEKKPKPDKKSVIWGLVGLLFACIGGFSDPPIVVYIASAIAIIIGIFNLLKHPRWKPLSVVVIILSLYSIGFNVFVANKNSQWNTVEHLGLKFDVPGYYHLEDTTDGSIWYESDPAGVHLYYINGFSFQEGDDDWIIDKLNLAWGSLSKKNTTLDKTANGDTVYTTKYSGKISGEDVNGEISILPYTNKGTYIFVYLEYPCDKKYEENYHKTLQSITSSGETLPNTQIAMKEVTVSNMHINVPEYFELDSDVSRDDYVRYGDSFSHIDISFGDCSGIDESKMRTSAMETLSDSASYSQFNNNETINIENVTSHDKDDDWYAFSTYTVSGAHDGKGNTIMYFNNMHHEMYVIDLYGSYIASGYRNKFNDILQSIKFDQPSSNIKELADGFESFMNEYIDFMLAVKNKSSMSALSEYTQLLAEYADWMTKINNVDTTKLSETDAAYFLEVYARVMGKLASAGLSN